ncbi:MAG: RidA family protein [Proteobacteria bacterium]|nr:RidA family protein [Pseudomonadota bacterium]
MAKNHIQFIQPEHFARPRGYANGAIATGRTLYIAGQIGWEADQTFASDEFVYQFGKALDNVLDVVEAAGGVATDLVQMTVYATDLDAYRASAKELGAVWRERLGKHFPAMALVGVAGLVHPRARVEIEAVACLAAER